MCFLALVVVSNHAPENKRPARTPKSFWDRTMTCLSKTNDSRLEGMRSSIFEFLVACFCCRGENPCRAPWVSSVAPSSATAVMGYGLYMPLPLMQSTMRRKWLLFVILAAKALPGTLAINKTIRGKNVSLVSGDASAQKMCGANTKQAAHCFPIHANICFLSFSASHI